MFLKHFCFSVLKWLFFAYALWYPIRTHGAVYKDFEEFQTGEIISHGYIFLRPRYIKTNARNSKFNNIYLEATNSSEINEICDCGRNRDCLGEKRILVDVHFFDLQALTKCLLAPPSFHKDQRSEISLITSGPGWDTAGLAKANGIELFKSLQNIKVRVGFRMNLKDYIQSASEKVQLYKDNGITINHFIVEIPLEYFQYYDYNSFAANCNKTYIKLGEARRGESYQVVLELKFQPFPKDESKVRYELLIAKFFYRWGEESKRPVIVNHDWQFQNTSNGTASLLQEIFEKDGRVSNAPFIASLTGENMTKVELAKQFKNAMTSQCLCQDFKSIRIDIPAGIELTKADADAFIGMHSKVECNFPVILQLSGRMDPRLLRPILEFILEVNTKTPKSIELVFMECELLDRLSDEQVQILKNASHLLGHKECVSYRWRTPGKHRRTPMIVEVPRDEGGKSIALENLPSLLHNLYQRLHKSYRKRPIYVDAYWATKEIEMFGRGNSNWDCYGFKTYWNILKNWADVHAYTVVSKENLFAKISYTRFGTYRSTWFKTLPNMVSNTTSVNLARFRSNYRDTCVKIPDGLDRKPLEFPRNLSGVTFRVTDEYSDLRNDQTANLLNLLHGKFDIVEFILHASNLSSIHAIKNAIKYNNDTRGKTGHYYLHVSDLMVSNILKTINQPYMDGIHVKFQQLTQDSKIPQDLRKSFRKFGIVLTHEESSTLSNSDLAKELIPAYDYIVVHLNIAEVLLKQNIFSSPYTLLHSDGDDILPYEVFNNLRADRFKFQQINPKIEVVVRIAWPTIQKLKSIQRSIKIWSFVRDFSINFQFPFLVYEAFDKRGDLQFGWWKRKNASDFEHPENYVEKQADYYQTMHLSNPGGSSGANSGGPISTSTSPEVILGAIAFFLVILLALAVLLYRHRKLKVRMMLTAEELYEFKYGQKSPNDPSASEGENKMFGMAYNKAKYEIDKAEFKQGQSVKIGSGQFGDVYKATLQRYGRPVAVKVPKVADPGGLKGVIREIKLMSYVGEHDHVVALLGAYTKEIQTGVVYIVIEFLENGSLLEYLRRLDKPAEPKERDALLVQMFQFCVDISIGMDFLAEKKVIHGDLSTRNVLLNEQMQCKIADFGLSRKLYGDISQYVSKSMEPLPWKWMAIESLQRSEYSIKSDTWSLGVTFWEIFSFGDEPYPGLAWDNAFCPNLINGLRLSKPNIIGNEIYAEIMKCWEIIPEHRPNARHFVILFKGLRSGYVEVN